MAEYIEHNIEEMLPELEQIVRVGLLDTEQLQALLRRRRRLEYKVARRSKRPRDYQAYIRHEVRLLAFLKRRRHSLGYQFKRDEIERSIVCRVQRLHRQLCYRFQAEPQHWLAAARFLEVVGFLDSAGKTLHRMLQVHTDRPELWVLASRWFWEAALLAKCERLRSDKERTALLAREAAGAAALGRDILLRGLRRLPDAALLYRELIALEATLGARLLAALSNTEGENSLTELPSTASELDWEAVRRGDSVRVVVDVVLDRWPQDRELIEQVLLVCQDHMHLKNVTELVTQRLNELPLVVAEDLVQEDFVAEEKAVPAPKLCAVDQLTDASRKGGLVLARRWWKEALVQRPSDAAAAAVLYISLEAQEAAKRGCTVNMARVRKAAETALSGFGRAALSPDLWLTYIRIEERHGEASRVAQLDWRARKFLKDEFLTEYSLRRLYPHLEQTSAVSAS